MTTAHPLGTIARIWRYPVKSLRAQPLDEVRVALRGLEGDRASALFVESPEHARSGKPFRGKEHPLLHTLPSAAKAAGMAALGGVALRERDGGPYYDAGDVSLLFDTWLAEAERLTGLSLDPLRFRPNFYVTTDGGFALGEADALGARFALGEVVLRVEAVIQRCVTPSYDIATGAAEPRIPRAIAQQRDNVMGVYCAVERTGTVALGDAVVRID